MQTTAATYLLYITMGSLVLAFVGHKLRLLSLTWLYPSQRKNQQQPPISVVIAARNDAEALQKNIPFVATQVYPEYEIILVDDASEDETAKTLDELVKNSPAIKRIKIPEKTSPGKKAALVEGIQQAAHSFLLLTDADCEPESSHWISTYASLLGTSPSIITGYGKYRKTKGFLNLFIRFDTSMIGINYMNKALWGYPYMGVGRNMGYSKELSPALKNLDMSLASGDDDLFVQAAAKKARVIVNLEPGSFTVSEAKTSWQAWMMQKARHTTTAPQYSFFHKAWLTGEWMVKAIFYTGLISLFFTNYYQQAWIFFFLHTCVLLLSKGLWMYKMGEKDMILSLPILDFIYTFVQPVFVIKSRGRKKEEWI